MSPNQLTVLRTIGYYHAVKKSFASRNIGNFSISVVVLPSIIDNGRNIDGVSLVWGNLLTLFLTVKERCARRFIDHDRATNIPIDDRYIRSAIVDEDGWV